METCGVVLVEDVAQKSGKHVLKNDAWSSNGVQVVRNKLPVGDYVLMYKKVVDTKRDINELCMDVMSDHRRFRDAAIFAQSKGTHLVILVENEDGVRSLDDLERWTEPDKTYLARKRKRPNATRHEGRTVARICRSMSEEYGLEFDFCTPDEAWAAVLRHLGVVV